MAKSDVYVIGIGMTKFGRHLDKSIKQLVAEAINQALQDSGLDRELIQEAYFANCVQGFMEGQHMIRGHAVLLEQGFEGIPIFNVESGCASGSMALHQAVRSILADQADIVLAVGAEKMVSTDKIKMFEAFNSAWDIERTQWQKSIIADMWSGFESPPGSSSSKPYSPFMDVYKGEFFNHVRDFGATQAQLAAICAKNHQHSVHNPKAQFQQAFSVEEVLASPSITYPLTLPMCSPISDGAAAIILCSSNIVHRLNISTPHIKVLGTVTVSGMNRKMHEHHLHIVSRAANKLYEKTGVAPGDINVVELHDATAVGELIEVENLGLCEPGMGGVIAERGDTRIGGKIPVNPSGGLESRGHPIAATGIAQLYELTLQLRGQAGARQIKGSRLALQCNVGGFWGVEEASAHVALLGI